MNIVVVTPGHPGPDRLSLPPSLTAPYLAALATPFADRIKIYDLAVESFDPSAPVPDVALFTTTMAQFNYVYNIAKYLKEKGVKIFFGGPYATLCRDFDPRIREIADCIVLGEGEKALPQALKDYKEDQLQPEYAIPIVSLNGIPFSRLDLLDHRKYYSSTVLISTRGCTHDCEYCSIKDIYGHKFLIRPVEEVIEEIRFQTARPDIGWLDRKFITFWDDSPSCDLDWFNELLEQMIPLKKWWISQICLNVADNEKTLKLMKASGCKGVFVGLESVSEETLRGQKKENINIVSEYKRQAKKLLEHGINFVGAIMYGFDQDTKDSLFIKTPEVLQDMGLTVLQTHMVTPYPHSSYFKMLAEEDRIISRETKYYNGFTVVHKPKNIHPADLQEGFIQTRKQFYSWRSIIKRLCKHRFSKIPDFLLWNFLYYRPNHMAIPEVNIEKWLNDLRTLS